MVRKKLCSLYVGLALAGALATGAAADEHRNLVIGISQFPSNLNPNIDAMAAKSFVAYDHPGGVHPGESILSGGGRLGRLSVAPRAT